MERFVAIIFSGILKYSGKSAENDGNFIKNSGWQSRVNHPGDEVGLEYLSIS
jgi:hypothetical protein